MTFVEARVAARWMTGRFPAYRREAWDPQDGAYYPDGKPPGARGHSPTREDIRAGDWHVTCRA